MVIFDQDATRHASHVETFLQCCVERQIILNTDKWVYTRPDVDFAGFHFSSPILLFFDPGRDTRLCTDTSCQGLGFVLQQLVCETWVLVQAGSRFLLDVDSRYAVVVLEMLGVSPSAGCS